MGEDVQIFTDDSDQFLGIKIRPPFVYKGDDDDRE